MAGFRRGVGKPLKVLAHTAHIGLARLIVVYSEDMAGLMRLVLGYGYMSKLPRGKGVQLYSTLAAPQAALTLRYDSSLSSLY